MAKTLVINGSNYSVNALDTVIIGESIPCTGIVLNKQTAEIMSIGGTTTLVPTLTPVNTTDTVSWASSDSDVATVADGVVTTVGVGTATITATCGTQSATCVITSRAFMDTENVEKLAGKYMNGTGIADGGNGLIAAFETGRCGGMCSSEGVLHLHNEPNLYPYVLPKNTGIVKVTPISGAINSLYYCIWVDSTSSPSGYASEATLIKNISTPTKTGDSWMLDVPSIEGYTIDSIVLSLRVPSGSTLTDDDLDGIEVEFLPSTN